MKTILVPVDFSAASRNAANYAAQLAKQNGADLFLLSVYTDPVPVMEASIPVVSIAIELQQEYRVRILKEIKHLTETYGVSVKGEAMAGLIGDSIKETAEELGADLICLGRKAKKYNRLLGSTISKVIRKTNVPVMVIPEGATYQPLKRIVLAVDFKEMLHDNCMAPLFNIARATNASLSVLHIEKSGVEFSRDEVPEKLQLGRVLSRITYLFEKAENDDVEAGILKFVDAHPTDLLVMIAHRHNFVARLLGEAHTQPLAFDVNIPVLILKNKTA